MKNDEYSRLNEMINEIKTDYVMEIEIDEDEVSCLLQVEDPNNSDRLIGKKYCVGESLYEVVSKVYECVKNNN